MKTVGAYEAKTHLPSLLERVVSGERITLTKYGVPVAMLVPVQSTVRRDIKSTIETIKGFRKGRSLDGLSLSEMIREGRR